MTALSYGRIAIGDSNILVELSSRISNRSREATTQTELPGTTSSSTSGISYRLNWFCTPNAEGRPLDAMMLSQAYSPVSEMSDSPVEYAARGKDNFEEQGREIQDHRDDLSAVPGAEDPEQQKHVHAEPLSNAAQSSLQLDTAIEALRAAQDQLKGSNENPQSPQQDDHTLERLTSQHQPARAGSNATKLSIPLSLFKDFDGVHTNFLTGEASEDAVEPVESDNDDRESISSIRPRHERRFVEPPPAEGMVYYPAPVPAVLNLPKRLRAPQSASNPARRSQPLQSLPIEARKSVMGPEEEQEHLAEQLSPPEKAKDTKRKTQRQSAMDLQKLPPQLRATVFFDHPAIPQQVEMKDGSATATLDRLLDASVDAPVWNSTGFTSGGPERQRRSTTSLLDGDHREGRKSQLSMLSGGRRASTDLISRTAKRSNTRLSLGTDLGLANDLEDDTSSFAKPVPTHHGAEERRSSRSSQATDQSHNDGGHEPEAADSEVNEHQNAESEHNDDQLNEEVGEFIGAPTTLMAELHLRKKHLKDRTRTAATSFPQGMHSTLLELEAVAQIEKAKRRQKPTRLAWEDPNAQTADDDHDADEDVPLGVLFPVKNGLVSKRDNADWNKPLGLVAAKARELNEPLSSRRMRLKGIDPRPRGRSRTRAIPEPEPEDLSDPEHQDETLAQRNRRLRTRKALDEAIGAAGSANHVRGVSADFASEMMSQFGGLDAAPEADPAPTDPQPAAAPVEPEETLGQRRKRLQAEAQSRQVSKGTAATAPIPDLGRRSPSIANTLFTAPANGTRNFSSQTQATTAAPLAMPTVAKSPWANPSVPSLQSPPSKHSLLGGAYTHGFGAGPLPANGRASPYAPLNGSGAAGWQNPAYGMRLQTGQMAQGQDVGDERGLSPSQRENVERWRWGVGGGQ
ncbi:MAG: hypothetical protein M1828_001028 [Chrysothrix sp. TS-e1954]|nr:MAG: hypothetical protein M1828_001028 [Chrysothrix sp. TS-e1954]